MSSLVSWLRRRMRVRSPLPDLDVAALSAAFERGHAAGRLRASLRGVAAADIAAKGRAMYGPSDEDIRRGVPPTVDRGADAE